MTEAVILAAITAGFGFIATLLTLSFQLGSANRQRKRVMQQEMRSLAAVLASEIHLAAGLVSAFRSSSQLLYPSGERNDEAFSFINKYRSIYGERAAISNTHAFKSSVTRLGLLPAHIVTRCFNLYAQFDRIVVISRAFWANTQAGIGSDAESRYFFEYMPQVYEKFLREAGEVESILFDIAECTADQRSPFYPILSYEKMVTASRQATPQESSGQRPENTETAAGSDDDELGH